MVLYLSYDAIMRSTFCVGSTKGGETSSEDCLLHRVHNIYGLSLHHCDLLPGHGVSDRRKRLQC